MTRNWKKNSCSLVEGVLLAFTRNNNTKKLRSAGQNSDRLASECRIKPLLPLQGKPETIAEVLCFIRLFNAID